MFITYKEFPRELNSGRILKICQHLPKLCLYDCFLRHSVYLHVRYINTTFISDHEIILYCRFYHVAADATRDYNDVCSTA